MEKEILFLSRASRVCPLKEYQNFSPKVGQHREEEEEENPAPSRTFQDFALKQRKIREAPKEIRLLGWDVVASMWMWSLLEQLLERPSSFPGVTGLRFQFSVAQGPKIPCCF